MKHSHACTSVFKLTCPGKRSQVFVRFFLFTLLLGTSLFSDAQNAIVTENLLPGSPKTDWEIPNADAGDLSIQGFATDISFNKGQTVRFKINTPAISYSARIYRLGYYQGNGARFIANAAITAALPQTQPACISDPSTGLVDCGNWSQSAEWTIPGTAVSGIYILRLQRTDIATTNCSHVIFIVRDDASTADLYFQTSDATWQAYNGYGGYSLYTGSAPYPNGRGVKVSYNRPITTRGGGGGSSQPNFVFNAEYPMVRWLERNGYNVSYCTNVDVARFGSLLLNHKVFLSVGHDEYWNTEMRNNVEAARNAGVHLAFFSGNEVYWKSRFENSVDGSGTPYKTLVCYKESIGNLGDAVCNGKCDPDPNTWTGLWRDGCDFPPAADACKPENALTGQISYAAGTANLKVPATYKNLRFWRNTSIASLGSGQTATLPYGILGYEFDYEQYTGSYPNGRITLSNTNVFGVTHKLSLYKYVNGPVSSWVFGAGTIQWSWGLDGDHDQGTLPPSKDIQQATVNLFADMNVQPGTLQSDLISATASTDITAPVSLFTSPASGGNVIAGSVVTLTGTASDANAVGGVEISTDGGTTWRVAEGMNTWSFSFTAPATPGTITIRCRAYDDSGNMEATGASGPNVITLNIVARPDPGAGFGNGAILVVHKNTNPFSKYTAELLRAEGLNSFDVEEISNVTPAVLANYDVVILGEMTMTAGDVTNLTNFVNAGGTLIAFRPDAQLAPLLGLTPVAGTLSNQYLLINNSGPGTGIVNETVQFHGAADFYTLNGATSLATLYSSATIATIYPAVTTHTVGSNNGKAVAFAFDLSKSIVYTRQGNPAWAGQNRDDLGGPAGPIRPNDLFFGNAPGDPQPDWIDFNKISIPQADEQQRFLANILLQSNLHRKPLPRFWYLPSGHKAAVVLAGDGHGNGGAVKRFEKHKQLSGTFNTPADVADWKAVRGTVYLYPNAPITNLEALSMQNDGFEFSLGVDATCTNFTPASLETVFNTQLGQWATQFTGLTPTTNRAECMLWSDWATMAKKEAEKGIHLDMTYMYFPDSWHLDRPGMYTGSGLPMRFADADGSLIDCYQVPTQIDDQYGITVATHITSLLNKAVGPEGYYGTFGTNFFADIDFSPASDLVIAEAKQRNLPIISAKQLLTWLDGRNSSSFRNLSWSSNTLTFVLSTNPSARNIQAMLPASAGTGTRLISVSRNASPVTFRFETIKGIEYAFFNVESGNYTAVYDAFTCTTPSASLIVSPTSVCSGDGTVSLQLNAATGTAPYTIVVNGTTYNNVQAGVPFQTTIPDEVSIWDNSVVGGPAENVLTPSIEVGVKFRSSVNGYITGIRFYKLQSNTGPHTGSLWSAGGALLATATFTNETQEGWQTVKFASPVFITANTTYTASYFAPYGQFSGTPAAFNTAGITNGPLTLLQDGVDGGNGVFKYGVGGVFPDDSFNGTNYWVDVTFVPNLVTAQSRTFTLSSMTDFNNCSNAGPVISTASVTVNPLPCNSLPVELLSFSASAKQNDVLLNWITESEQNNAGFEVQRSTDGRKWIVLGFVNGAGYSNSRLQYQFTDADVAPGRYLYRLNQLDADGKQKYSATVAVVINGATGYRLGQNFPNPATGETTISYSLPERAEVTIGLYDVHGRLVQLLVNRTQQPGTYNFTLPVSNLPKGQYLYRMQAGKFSAVKKLVVQ